MEHMCTLFLLVGQRENDDTNDENACVVGMTTQANVKLKLCLCAGIFQIMERENMGK